MVHPTRKMVEALHAKGACPRIQVDMKNEKVVCPDFVRDRWKDTMVVDLDPTYPLALEYTERGLEANLSFDGIVTRCVFPFESILIVVDRDTGKGMRVESEASQRDKDVGAAARRAALRVSGRREKGKSRRRRRAKAPGEEPAAPEIAAVKDEGAESSDEQAERRRAVFKVIDGEG